MCVKSTVFVAVLMVSGFWSAEVFGLQDSSSNPKIPLSQQPTLLDELSNIKNLQLGRMEDEAFGGENYSGQSALDCIDSLSRLHYQNKKSIETWKGIAHTSFWHRKNGDVLSFNRFQFEYDQKRDAEKVTVQALKKVEGENPVGVFSNFSMRIGGDIFRVNSQPGIANQIHKVIITHGNLNPGFESGDFSPLHFFTVHSRSFEDNVTVFSRFQKQGAAEITAWKDSQYAHIRYRVPSQKNQDLVIELDLNKGCNITRLVSSSAFETERRNIEYERIDDVWVPKRILRAITYSTKSSSSQDRSFLMVFDNEINLELRDDAFEITGLNLGDKLIIQDER